MENYSFYINSINSNGFYKRDNFIEICKFDSNGEFISQYLLNLKKIKSIPNDEILEYVKNGLNKFFNEMKIDKNNPEKQPLNINNEEVGEIIILKFCSPIKGITSNNIDNKIENQKEKKNNVKQTEIKNNSTKQNEIKNNVKQNIIKRNEIQTERNKNVRRNEIKINENHTESNKNAKQNKINNFFKDFEKERKEENKLDDNIKCFKDIKITPMIGLENIGQTCYMNAALQCFSNSYALVNYFLDSNKISFIENAVKMKNPDEPQLTSEFQALISNLWIKKSKNYYSPHNYKSIIGKIESLFKNFKAKNVKVFVNYIIIRLHEELNGIDNSFTNTN
jgi:hypothetical protein